MSRAIIAKRYAKALFEASHEQNIVEQVEQELQLIVQFVEQDKDFKKFLEHPNIDNDIKNNVLQAAFGSRLSPIVYNTLELIIARGREAMLSDLLAYYIAIANEALGQEDAVVYSATALSAEQIDNIAHVFGELTGKKIKVNHIVDASLLGGLRVRIGDRLYDGSLSNKLNQLQKSLIS